jgi:cytochrome oxidase Cu insertion factor (SCO1/SenC/PrrC family)
MAMIALVAIVATSAMWCWLALWPAGAGDPEWILRARAACFGAAPGGLPDAGGWILLVGEPVGMVAALLAIWGRSLRADVQRLRGDPLWRALATGLAVAAVVGAVVLGVRTTRAYAAMRAPVVSGPGVGALLDADAPAIILTDQHGRRVSFADFRGHPVLITFAFGHCTTVCPVLVRDLLIARNTAHRSDVGLAVVTLDPWRDTPDRLPTIASHWNLGPDDRVLSGGEAEVNAALDALGIGRQRNETTGDIVHVGNVLYLNERGKIAWRLDGGWGRVGDLLLRR